MTDVDRTAFEDVRPVDGGFSIPELKWRELLFIGALRREGDAYLRDVARPLPEFALPGLFPEGRRLRATREGGRIALRPEAR